MHDYKIPAGLHAIPSDLLDLRSDDEVDQEMTCFREVVDDKNIWFFWHSGYASMPVSARRSVRAHHRRLSRLGWRIRVVDRVPGSPHNISCLLDLTDPDMFPVAFRNEDAAGGIGSIGSSFPAQVCSDLVRFPLLLRYGGLYADVGVLPIGDLDRLWHETIAAAPSSTPSYEVITFGQPAGAAGQSVTNYFMGARRDNALFRRCHRLLIQLWREDGGRTSPKDTHRSPLLQGLPLIRPTSGDGADVTWIENGRAVTVDEGCRILTDYLFQGQVINITLGTVDERDGWDGPRYAREHIFAMDFASGSQLLNYLTSWDGRRQFALLSLPLPAVGEVESAEQTEARLLVEQCLQRSFVVKLATGLIRRVLGETLGTLWESHPGSDDVPGTYAHWLRYATVHLAPDALPVPIDVSLAQPIKRGPLLEA